jgi:Protein of unknown function (DUF2909)
MSYWIAFSFVLILASLGVALFFMMRGGQGPEGGKKNPMSKALAWRVGLSILLFLSIMLAWSLGYLQPTGIPIRHP